MEIKPEVRERQLSLRAFLEKLRDSNTRVLTDALIARGVERVIEAAPGHRRFRFTAPPAPGWRHFGHTGHSHARAFTDA